MIDIFLVISATRSIRVIFKTYIQQAFNHVRLDPVVGIDEADELALGDFQAGVAGPRKAAVRLVDDGDSCIPFLPAVADGVGAVGGAVINKNDLQILICLSDDGDDAIVQIFLDLIDRNDDGNQRFHLF